MTFYNEYGHRFHDGHVSEDDDELDEGHIIALDLVKAFPVPSIIKYQLFRICTHYFV